MTIKIEHDPFYVVERLREIDPSYYVVYNCDKCQYEVHSTEQMGSSFCFSVKFPNLDERTVTLALRTRSEKVEEIIKALDEENEKTELRLARAALEKIQEGLC